MNRRRSNRHSGFTLMEVLVAVGILGLMSAMMMSALGPALEGKARVERLQVAFNRMSRFLNRLERELRGSYFGSNPASTRKTCGDRPENCPYVFIGKNRGEVDELRFVTTALTVSTHQAASDEAIIAYFVGKGTTDTGVAAPGLFRQQTLVHDQSSYTKYAVGEREVLPAVTRFNLRYLQRGTENEWVEEWESTDETTVDHFNQLPRAVEILVSYDDPDAGSQTLYTMVSIPAAKPCKVPPGAKADPQAPGKKVGDQCL